MCKMVEKHTAVLLRIGLYVLILSESFALSPLFAVHIILHLMY